MAQSKPLAQGTDITERKQAEEALRRSEERYRSILESIQEGYFETDLDGNYTFVNDANCRFLGYTKEELVGMNYRQHSDEKNAKELREHYTRLYLTGKPIEGLGVESIRKDGTKTIYETSVSLIRDSEGKPIGFRGVSRDITERKKIEEALRKSEEKYRTILEEMAEGYFEIDLKGNYTFANESVCKRTGYSREELIGMNNRQYTDKTTATKMHELYSEVYRTGKTIELDDYELIRKDGTKYQIELSVSLKKDASGKPIGFRGISRDITERKKMEDTLRKSEERYRTVLEDIHEGYFEVDLAGKYTFVNNALCKNFKYTKEELIGTKNQQYQDKANATKTYQAFNELYRTGEPVKAIESEHIRKDGTKGTYELSASLIRDAQGKPIGFRGTSRDVTERKKMEEALRKSEKKYRTILESIAEGYYEADLTGNFTFFNDSLCKIFGYPREELLGMNYKQYTDNENGKKCFQIYNKIYSTGEPDKVYEYEIIRKDGTKKYLEASASLQKDSSNKPIMFRGIIRDITERKNVEEALLQSEERYRTMLANIGDAYTETDLSGKVTFFNKVVSESLGYTEKEFFGMHYKDYAAPESVQKIYETYNKVYRTGETAKSVELLYVAKGGTKKILEATVVLQRDKSDKPIGFKTFTTDITQRRRAEEALRQSEERYRTIIENIQDGYFELDLTGNFTFVNDMICRHLEYSKEELIGMSYRQYQDEKNTQKTYQAFHGIYRTGEPVKALDMEVIRKDGTKGISELSISLIRDAQGKPIGFRGVSRDVTERRKVEEQLKRYATELERSNEEVKNFAYIVSHDLRVPLVNLKGYTSELRSALGIIGSNFDAALPHLIDEKRSAVAMALHEDVPEALEFITNSVTRMDSFINAVLILARLGRQDLKPEPIDMNALLQTTVETMSHQLQERGIEVIVGSLPQVVADRTAMEQIMGNILGNAVKYLDSSRPGRIEVTAQANGAETTFRIGDNGRGIAAEDMGKVFAPFRRAGKQDTPGEGMGLAYVQTLLRRHGGRISCESELGKGTTFTFTISTRPEKGARDV